MRIYLILLSFFAAHIALASVDKNRIHVQISDTKLVEVENYGLDLAYLEANSEKLKTILFIHGNSASKEFFENLMQEPALREFRLIAVDLPGHGESSDFPQEVAQIFTDNEERIFLNRDHYYTFAGYANVLNRFLSQLGISSKDVCIFGWSLGGHVAIDMAQSDVNFSRVVLTGTPIKSFATMGYGFRALSGFKLGEPFESGSTFLDLIGYRKHFTADQAGAFHAFGGVPSAAMSQKAGVRADPEARHFVVKFCLEASSHSSEMLGYEDQDVTVQRQASKFLVLQGERDPIRIQGDERKQVEDLGVRIHEIKGVGHATILDSTAEVAGIIAEEQTE